MSRADKVLNSRAQLRERSKKLYGNADRLEVAFAVATSSGLVHAQELSNRLGISPPRVRTQLLSFVDAGVMQALPRSGQTQNYERLDDPFWDSVEALVKDWLPPRDLGRSQVSQSDWQGQSPPAGE